MDLALNNQPWLMCHKTKPNQIDSFRIVSQIIFNLTLEIGIKFWISFLVFLFHFYFPCKRTSDKCSEKDENIH